MSPARAAAAAAQLPIVRIVVNRQHTAQLVWQAQLPRPPCRRLHRAVVPIQSPALLCQRITQKEEVMLDSLALLPLSMQSCHCDL